MQRYNFQALMDGIACWPPHAATKKLTKIDYNWEPAAVYACQDEGACKTALQSVKPSGVSLEAYQEHKVQVRQLALHVQAR